MNKKLLIMTAVAGSLIGCTKLTPAQIALDQVNKGNIDKGSRACEVQEAEYSVDPTLISFELTDSGGVNAGFSILNSFLKLISVNFQAAAGQLTMGLALKDPMVPSTTLTSASGGGTSVQFSAAVDAGFQSIGAGFNYAHTTPLATLTHDSIDDAFTNLTAKMDAKQAEWKTQVVAVPSDSQFVIPAGSYANVQVGDLFAIYNVNHQWAGTPCASQYYMGVFTTPTPLAVARVDQVEANGALLTKICNETYPCPYAEKVQIGAAVRISKLTDNTRVLARLMRINPVVANGKIQYENNQSVDLTPFIRDIIGIVAGDHNFLVYGQ